MRAYRNQVLAGLLFISIVLIAVVAVTGANELVDRLDDFPLWLFVPVFLLKCLNWVLRYSEWRYFLGVIGVRTVHHPVTASPENPAIRERDSFLLWMAGLTLVVSPGKLAEVLKSLVLKNLSGAEFSRTVPVVFMERVIDGFAVIILASAALFFIPGTLDSGDTPYVRAVLLGTLAVLILGFAIVQYRRLALWLLDQVTSWPLLRRVQGALRNLYESTYDLLKIRHVAPMVLVGMAAYLCDCIGYYLLLRGLDVTGSWTLFGQATFILGFSVIVASLSAMPGGAGGRELTVGAMMTGVVGLSKADAGTATFLISIFQVWIGVLVGLGVIALFRETLFPPALEDEIRAYQSGVSRSEAK